MTLVVPIEILDVLLLPSPFIILLQKQLSF